MNVWANGRGAATTASVLPLPSLVLSFLSMKAALSPLSFFSNRASLYGACAVTEELSDLSGAAKHTHQRVRGRVGHAQLCGQPSLGNAHMAVSPGPGKARGGGAGPHGRACAVASLTPRVARAAVQLADAGLNTGTGTQPSPCGAVRQRTRYPAT